MMTLIYTMISLFGFTPVSPLAPALTNQSVDIILNEPFELMYGDMAKFEDWTIHLDKIIDSRCPVNVNCIRAGEIVVNLSLISDGRAKHFELANPTWERKGSSKTYGVGEYRLRFIGEAPSKKIQLNPKKQDRNKGDLVLLFVLEKAVVLK